MVSPQRKSTAGIGFIVVGVVAISFNDMMIKALSGGYPLHQIVFIRSLLGLLVALVLVQIEGGWRVLATGNLGLHTLRGLLLVAANMGFFLALATLPLADATALFFAAPIFITLLSIPFLGERVGPLRMAAVVFGFAGVLLMQRPWASPDAIGASRFVLMLPVLAALCYALLQLMTRKLGETSKASALAIHTQLMFLVVSVLFWIFAGDGRFAEASDNPSVQFLLRAWIWPEGADWWPLIGLGLNSGIIGYCLSQAYRLSDAATVAPFEYVGLPMAVLWGWLIWSELPDLAVWAGMTLIIGSGLFVFFREKQRSRQIASSAEVKGRY